MIRRLASCVLAAVLVSTSAAWCATVNVGGATQDLIDAVNAANSGDTLVLTNTTYSLSALQGHAYGPSGLPTITITLTIEGSGATITRSSGTLRFFHVASTGNLTLRNLELANGYVHGGNGGGGGGGGGAGAGMGGAVFSQGTLTLENCTLSANQAVGGTGGPGGGNAAGGGGGGMGGDGGDNYSWSGGGGGGFTGNGGNGNSGAGGLYGGGGGGASGDFSNPKVGGVGNNTGGNGGNGNATTGLTGVGGGIGGGGGGGGYYEDPDWNSYGGNGGNGGIGGGGGGGVFSVGGIGGWGGGAGASGQYTNGRAGGFGGGGSAAGYGYNMQRPGGAGGWGGGAGGESEDTCGGGGGGAGFGGAIFVESGTATITNCTLSGNSATGGTGGDGDDGSWDTGGGGDGGAGCGGAIFVHAGSLSIKNCTIASNTVTGGGGGAPGTSSGGTTGTTGTTGSALGAGFCVYGGSLTITNTIAADSAGGVDCYSTNATYVVSSGYNLVQSATNCTFASTGDLFGAGILPALDALADNGGLTRTHALQSTSDAIAGGNDAVAPALDQRGYARDGVSDIGAYEYNGAPLPEIAVEGNGVTIADGDSSPSTTDHTDFGTVDVVAGFSVRTFTIRNSGFGTLTVGTVTVTGDFALTSSPGGSVPAGGTTTFQVTFDPTAAGLRTGTVSIANNDSDENPYGFSIQGTGDVAPEIAVLGNGTEIASGDMVPLTADHTDFGDVGYPTQTLTRTFTISNTGSATLDLSGPPYVTIGGAMFSLDTDAVASVAPGGSETFLVEFAPTAAGLASGTVTIASNDADESTYVFAIQGTGVPVPEIVVSGNSVDIANGDVTPDASDHTDFGAADIFGETVARTFTIRNDGTGDLNLTDSGELVAITGADFTLTVDATTPVASGGGTTTFVVTFDPSAPGTRSGTVSIANDDSDEDPYTFSIQGTGTTSPEMDVEGLGNTPITDGDAVPSPVDGTNFGSANVAGETVVRTFTIVNTGSGPLALTGASPYVTVDHADFTITVIPTTPVASLDYTTFDVTFDPSSDGVVNATLSIANDDADEDPYDFAVRGTGVTMPEIAVEGNGVDIADGDATPELADHTDFGDADILTGPVVRTFTIYNTGLGELTLSDTPCVTLAQTGSDFTLTADATSPVAPSIGSTTFEITFDPSATGVLTATVSIANSDLNEDPFDFEIQGTGTATPDIGVQGNTTDIANGDVTPDASDHTDFGDADILADTVDRTFTIRNGGSADLVLSGTPCVAVSGTAFALTIDATTPVTPGGTSTFVVTFDPDADGAATGTVTIASDDPDDDPFAFSIAGNGTSAPEIAVSGNSADIPDGSASPNAGDHTHFGSVDTLIDTVTRTFTIENTGSAVLSLTDSPCVTLTGADFTLTADAPATIAAQDSATFQVTFDPSTIGSSTGTVSITNDDSDENPFDFSIEGSGVTMPEIEVFGNAVVIVSGDTSPSPDDHTDFGNARVSGGTVVRTFMIENVGSQTLALTDTPCVTVTGGDFTLTADAPETVASQGSATFEITFDPSASGECVGSVSIASDDADENPYTFDINGTGTVPGDSGGCAAVTGRGGFAAWLLVLMGGLALASLRRRAARQPA